MHREAFFPCRYRFVKEQVQAHATVDHCPDLVLDALLLPPSNLVTTSDVPIVGRHSRWAPPTAGVHVVSSQLYITKRLRLSCVAKSRREPGSLMAATAAMAAKAAKAAS